MADFQWQHYLKHPDAAWREFVQNPICTASHRALRGWSPKDAWSVDTYVSQILVGLLTALRAGHSYPADMTEGEWDATLTEMIEGFDAWARHWDYPADEEAARYAKVQRSLKLLRRHFGNLWD